MSKTIHLYQLDIDPTTEQHLLSLTLRHLKLAVEHGRSETPPSRRAEIRKEIEVIRSERDSIIATLDHSKNCWWHDEPFHQSAGQQLPHWSHSGGTERRHRPAASIPSTLPGLAPNGLGTLLHKVCRHRDKAQSRSRCLIATAGENRRSTQVRPDARAVPVGATMGGDHEPAAFD